MDHYLTLRSVMVFVENRIHTNINYDEMKKTIGFSLAHIRDVFSRDTGITLSRYVLVRRISNAAFEIIHSDENILNIAYKYGFSNPDTFTRAFKRITGMNPQEFRKKRCIVGRMKICNGVYVVEILMQNNEEDRKYHMNTRQIINANDSSTILYGVPKVGYGVYGATPFPICLKACANYLGEDIDYAYVMVECGAAFRFTWDTTSWFLGNVDISFTFDDQSKVYGYGIEGLGREYKFLERNKKTTKEEFKTFIKEQIDKGIPCIATGIIGPPEACVITGYRDDGNTLLGWNFYQENLEFGGKVELDECGYFICSDWWGNEGTQDVMSIGEIIGEKRTAKEIIATAIQVLSGHQFGQFAKGISAYDAWKKAIANDSEFQVTTVMPSLMEKLLCQEDAIICLSDGRSNAALYMDNLSKELPAYKDLCLQAKEAFMDVVKGIKKMEALFSTCEGQEHALRVFIQPQVRQQICTFIDSCKAADSKALEALKALYKIM